MEYRRLGATGVTVSRLCLGTANFYERTPRDQAIRIVHAALDAGINFVDTANIYGDRGGSEKIVGEALRGKRDSVVLATKVRGQMWDEPNGSGLSRHHIMRAVEESLIRLQTDHIDLYQMHSPDADTPIEETLRAMDDLVQAGKVRYFGTSNYKAWQICDMLWQSDRRGLAPVVTEQCEYHILERQAENELFPLQDKYELGLLAYSPIGGGLLSGRYSTDTPIPRGSRRADDWWLPKKERVASLLAKIDAINSLAAEAGMPTSRFALAWVLAQDHITCPIVGPRTMEHLSESLQATECTLASDQLRAVDEIVPRGSSL